MNNNENKESSHDKKNNKNKNIENNKKGLNKQKTQFKAAFSDTSDLNESSSLLLDESKAETKSLTKDKVPALLALLLTLGFFSMIWLMMLCPIQNGSREILDVLLGSVGTAWVSCITYYFGSSHSSQLKTQLLSQRKSL